MKLNIAIIDDESAVRRSIAVALAEWAEKAGLQADVSEYSSAEAFMFEHGDNNPYDILLLDVEMAVMSGIALAKDIRKYDRRAEIIFITSHAEFIGEGYEVDALHYLVKPVCEDKLHEVLRRAALKLREEPKAVVFNADGETVKLIEDDILYIESLSHYLTVHTANATYRLKENLSDFEKKLSKKFFRTHRSYIVSLLHITRISRTEVTLDDTLSVPISRGLYDAVNLAFIEQN